LFVIAVIFIKAVRYKHEISLLKDAKPSQEVELVCYNRAFVITKLDCSVKYHICIQFQTFLEVVKLESVNVQLCIKHNILLQFSKGYFL